MSPTPKQLSLLRIVAKARHGLDHEDKKLVPFCDDVEPTDTFNQCHEAGWLKTWHNSLMDCSTVVITQAGREALAALST